jgi:MFS family permease
VASGRPSRGSRLWAGVTAPVTALRRTARDLAVLRLQLAWAAVMTASWSATITLTVVAYSAGGSTAVSLAVLARTVPGAVAGPMIGAVVDRRSPQRSMAWAAALCGAACAGAAVARHVVVLVVIAMTVVATATMLFRAAQSAVMPDLVEDPAELVAANVLSSAIESVGVFAGPALAGLLLSWRGPRLTFLSAAALFAVATLLLVRRTSKRLVSTPSQVAPPNSLRELFRTQTARLLLSLVFAQTVVSGALVVLYAGLAVDTLRTGLGAVGLLTSAFGLGGMVGSLGLFALAGSARLGVLTAAALTLWAIPLALMPLTPSLVGVMVLLAVVGLGNVLFDVTSVTLLQRGVPNSLLARAFGVLETVVVLGLGLGALMAPPLERLLGPAPALMAVGVALAVVCLAALQPLRRLDAVLVAPVRQVALLRGLAPFALLPAPQLERLGLRLDELSVPAGHDVVVQGEPGDRYYVVDQGTLAVFVDGRFVVTLAEGEAFGEIALLHHRPRTATVTARTDARLWSLDGTVFVAALRTDAGRALAAADDVALGRLQRAVPRPTSPSPEGPPPAAAPTELD